jgi:superfamily II DNA/RNA helicase
LDDKTELFYTNLISNYINKDRNEIFKYFKTENVINEKDENDEKIVNDNIKEYNIIFYNKKHESIYEQKYKILIIILSSLQKKYNQCLIFYNKKNKGEELSQDLRNYGFSTCFIHGELNQDERQLIYSKIKNLEYKIILSTDLLSRGIDLTAVNLVINFDEAFDNIEHYHRIGRTGRFFEQGIVISFYGNKNDDKEILKNKNNYNENEIENVIKIIENEFILSERLSKEEIEKINKGENKNNNNILKEALTEINGVNILLQKKRKLQFEKESLIKEDINQKDEENDKRKSEKNDKLERNEIKDNILINERINNKKKHFCLYCNFMKIFDV